MASVAATTAAVPIQPCIQQVIWNYGGTRTSAGGTGWRRRILTSRPERCHLLVKHRVMLFIMTALHVYEMQAGAGDKVPTFDDLIDS